MSSDSFTRLALPRLGGPGLQAERDRARERGYAAGYAEGMRAATADAAHRAERDDRARRDADDAARATASDALSHAVAALESVRSALVERWDAVAAPAVDELFARAVELAEAIVERELSDPIAAALVAASRAERVRTAGAAAASAVVVLSPADAAILRDLDATPSASETSADLSPGDALVRLSDGAVDLRITAAFERARAALTEEG